TARWTAAGSVNDALVTVSRPGRADEGGRAPPAPGDVGDEGDPVTAGVRVHPGARSIASTVRSPNAATRRLRSGTVRGGGPSSRPDPAAGSRTGRACVIRFRRWRVALRTPTHASPTGAGCPSGSDSPRRTPSTGG